uniref:Uncharacterized protein n=1 Tax=Octopus bimaculoides TaxID=37653 RepID=A0A0L8HPU5_OCTBM
MSSSFFRSIWAIDLWKLYLSRLSAIRSFAGDPLAKFHACIRRRTSSSCQFRRIFIFLLASTWRCTKSRPLVSMVHDI